MYTDPGTISMMIAAAAGFILAIPTLLFIFRQKVKGWFDAKRKKQL